MSPAQTILPVINLRISTLTFNATVSLELITSCIMFHKSMDLAGFTVVDASLILVSFYHHDILEFSFLYLLLHTFNVN